MSTFRALVVDDDSDVRAKALHAAAPDLGVEVLVASSMSEAIDAIADNFLHVAVVDLELRKAPRQLGEGRTVLRGLHSGRPSCTRILLTRYATQMPEQVFELWDPVGRIVDGALDKASFGGGYFHNYLRQMAQDWVRAPVVIDNIDEVYELLSSKSMRAREILPGRTPKVSRDELQFVLASLLGQRMRNKDEPALPDDVARIELTPFKSGKSRSVVLHGRPVNRLGDEGLLCVVKVGPREDADEEIVRYERYVRLRMSLNRRVELLRHASGDTLGAIAYSFAGDDPGELGDLQGLLDEGDHRAIGRMRSVFAVGDEQRTAAEDGDDLAGFFDDAYNLRPRRVAKDIQDFADEQAGVHGWQHRRDELLLPGGKLHLPDDDDIGRGLLRMSYKTAVVHGDLNASNVITAADDRSILIDYRHTTRGPRALDYAAMQTSIRLSAPACEQPPEHAAADEQCEYSLWQHDWRSDDPWWPARAAKPPYWLDCAAELMLIASRALPDISRAEYAATCWLYALRVFRVRALTKDARLRLLIWISALSRVLADLEAQGAG